MKDRLLIIAPLLTLFFCFTALFPLRLAANTLGDESLPNVGVEEKLGTQILLTDACGQMKEYRHRSASGEKISF